MFSAMSKEHASYTSILLSADFGNSTSEFFGLTLLPYRTTSDKSNEFMSVKVNIHI